MCFFAAHLFSLYSRAASALAGEAGLGSHNKDCGADKGSKQQHAAEGLSSHSSQPLSDRLQSAAHGRCYKLQISELSGLDMLR
jgi:hypothetical protein